MEITSSFPSPRAPGRGIIANVGFCLVFSALLLFSPAFASAAEEAPVSSGLPVHMESEEIHYDMENQVVDARDTVLLETEGMEMELPGVTVETAIGQVTSNGPVSIHRGDAVFTGKSLRYNYSSGTGTIEAPAGRVSGVNVIASELQIEKHTMILKDVKASTCDPEHPDYHLAAKSLEIQSNGKARIKGGEFFLGNFRLLRWPSYSFSLKKPSTEAAAPSAKRKQFDISPPRFGYNRFGGVLVGSRVTLPLPYNVDAHLNYFLEEGFFPEMLAVREGRLGMWRVGAGKQWKENTGFFRYLGPVVVWSMPNVELEMKPVYLFGSGNPFFFSWETGRMRDSHSGRAMTRAVGKMHYNQRFARLGDVSFGIVSDARGALYSQSRKYSAAGIGLNMSVDWGGGESFHVQYMNFDSGGMSPLFYDRVDPNDKWFSNLRVKVAKKLFITLDTRYDSNEKLFDEVEYKLTREYNCTSMNLGWRKERSQILVNYRILGLPGRSKR